MKGILFVLFILYSLFSTSPALGAESQIWKVRPGDTFEIIATTLEIPKEEIRSRNPGASENNLQIGQRLKLPLYTFAESNLLEQELNKKNTQIVDLESANSGLENKLAASEAQLFWHPVWLWGFWLCFSVLAVIAAGAYWLFRQTHPQVFEEPHERSISDLRESQIRARAFSQDYDIPERGDHWQPPLKRVPHAR